MSIVFGILLFSLVIFSHELGHFLTAKLFGVQVNEFSIFMGPAIAKWQRGETLYAIRCIPFGGYCAMEGEDADSENPRAFGAAKWWKRLINLLAGSAVNFLVGVLLIAILYIPAKQVIVPEIDAVEEGSLVCGENGLQLGDRILEVDGEKLYIYQDFSLMMFVNEGDVHDLVVQRGDEIVRLDDFVMKKAEFTDPDGTKSLRYGFSFGIRDMDFGMKLRQTWNTALYYVRSVRLSLGMLISGKAGLADMMGPVGIVQQMSASAESAQTAGDALVNVTNMVAMLALNLAVMNVLPIPALDGGRAVCLLLTTAVEAITKKKINPKYEAYLHLGGMVLLIGLLIVITFKDIWNLF